MSSTRDPQLPHPLPFTLLASRNPSSLTRTASTSLQGTSPATALRCPFLIATGTLSAKTKVLKADLKNLQTQKEAFEEVTHDLEIKLEKAKHEISDLLRVNSTKSKALEKLERKQIEKESEIVKLKDSNKSLETKVDALEREKNSNLKALKNKENELNENLAETLSHIKKRKLRYKER